MNATNTMTINPQTANFLKSLEKNDKAMLITAANQYSFEKRSCGNIVNTYNEFVNVIKHMELKYGNAAFAPDTVFSASVDDLAARIETASNNIIGSRTYSCSFAGIEEANGWLATQKNISIKNLTAKLSRCSLNVEQINLEYTVCSTPTNKCYQICEEGKFRLYAESKIEKFKNQWQEQNRQFCYESCIKYKWSFGLFGSHFGYMRFIKEKYLVVYSLLNA